MFKKLNIKIFKIPKLYNSGFIIDYNNNTIVSQVFKVAHAKRAVVPPIVVGAANKDVRVTRDATTATIAKMSPRIE